MTESPHPIAEDDPEWCSDCGHKHSKCERIGEGVKRQIAKALRGAVHPVDIDGAADELLVVVERLQRAAVAEALRQAASEVMREHGTSSLAAKILRARAIAVDAL